MYRFATAAAALVLLTGCGNATQSPGTATTGSATSAPTGTPEATGSATTGAEAPTSAAAGQSTCPPAGGTGQRATTFTAPPPMCIDPKKTYTATVKTDKGTFTIALDPAKAPKTVNNFVFLARNHFYDGIVFHRVIPGFMNQTGDPEGTGMGGPGYEFADELPKAGEYKVGSVAMANAGPDTNGSQFFVVTGPNGVSLPPQYSLFGQVTSGMEVLHAIEKDGSESGHPSTQHQMEKVTVTEK